MSASAVCLYCGKRLGWVCNTEFKIDPSKPPNVCGNTRYHYNPEGKGLFRCKSRNFDRESGEYRCRVEECNALHRGRRVMVSREHRYEKQGPNGDGFFCSKEHGYRFGILAGKAGYRLKPVVKATV